MHPDLYFSPDAWGDQIKGDVIIWVHGTYGGIIEMQYTKRFAGKSENKWTIGWSRRK
jgi:hypothetical protein